ncbi:MAG: hypothetical protein D6741_00440 [Planctomycetota bacterium]|nr:MAG: hypothetical protein D6741_00440 [Planctomycetota bacterium]
MVAHFVRDLIGRLCRTMCFCGDESRVDFGLGQPQKTLAQPDQAFLFLQTKKFVLVTLPRANGGAISR